MESSDGIEPPPQSLQGLRINILLTRQTLPYKNTSMSYTTRANPSRLCNFRISTYQSSVLSSFVKSQALTCST